MAWTCSTWPKDVLLPYSSGSCANSGHGTVKLDPRLSGIDRGSQGLRLKGQLARSDALRHVATCCNRRDAHLQRIVQLHLYRHYMLALADRFRHTCMVIATHFALYRTAHGYCFPCRSMPTPEEVEHQVAQLEVAVSAVFGECRRQIDQNVASSIASGTETAQDCAAQFARDIANTLKLCKTCKDTSKAAILQKEIDELTRELQEKDSLLDEALQALKKASREYGSIIRGYEAATKLPAASTS
eukprot:jgi/Ulvmu1/1871/UM012_0027.1